MTQSSTAFSTRWSSLLAVILWTSHQTGSEAFLSSTSTLLTFAPAPSSSPQQLKVVSREQEQELSTTNNNNDDNNRAVTSPLLLQDDGDDGDDAVGSVLADPAIATLVQHTWSALATRGSSQALDALTSLSQLCQQRLPYDFSPATTKTKMNTGDNDDDDDDSTTTTICHLPNLLPANRMDDFLKVLADMESQGYWSQNPDSVDGLPSLHLNLISGGTPMVSDDSFVELDDLDDFEQGIHRLTQLIADPIYDTLLPQVQSLLNDDSIQVSDVFVRRYGQDIAGASSRNSISAHYDVFSRVTSVIALDNVAAQGTNGLYTTHTNTHNRASNNSSTTTTTVPEFLFGQTSNHASLRRFFPLAKGDAVVHTYDVLHGVDVEPGLDRTSLIVWFTSSSPCSSKSSKQQQALLSSSNDNAQIPWWLVDRINNNNASNGSSSRCDDEIVSFVLASALSSMDDDTINNTIAPGVLLSSEVSLYLASAKQGNSFALTRLGSLCEENVLSRDQMEEAERVLESLRVDEDLSRSVILEKVVQVSDISQQQELAMRFWFQGAIRGNPLAQHALADELMMIQAASSNENEHDTGRVLAATLFALAAQQGHEPSIDALSRVVQVDVDLRNVQSEEEFLSSPVVQIAQAAMSLG